MASAGCTRTRSPKRSKGFIWPYRTFLQDLKGLVGMVLAFDAKAQATCENPIAAKLVMTRLQAMQSDSQMSLACAARQGNC